MKRLIIFFISIGIFIAGCYYANKAANGTVVSDSESKSSSSDTAPYDTAATTFEDRTISCQYDNSILKISEVNPVNADNETYYCTGFTEYNSNIYDSMSNGNCVYIITNHITVSSKALNKPDLHAKALFDYLFNCTDKSKSSVNQVNEQYEYSFTQDNNTNYKAKILDDTDGYNTCLVYRYSSDIEPNLKEAFEACYNSVRFVAPPDLTIKKNSNNKKSEVKSNAATEAESNSTAETKPPMTKYPASTYKIGEDMPAGEYIIFTDNFSGYFELSKDSNGTLESIITNDNISTNSIITVSDGQYLKLSKCYAVPLSENPPVDISGDGMFKVGIHIPAGEYKLEANDDDVSGYVEVTKDSSHRLKSIVSNDNFEGTKYITVSDGQYLKLTRCKIKQ